MKTKIEDIEKAIEENPVSETKNMDSSRPPKIMAGRNDYLFKGACFLYSKSWPEEVVETSIQALNIHATADQHGNFENGPLDAKEIKSLLKSAKKYKGQISDAKFLEADAALAMMNEKYAVVMEAGKAIVISEEHDPDLERIKHVRSSFADIRNFYKELVFVRIERDTPKTEQLGKFWTNNPDARRYNRVVFRPRGTSDDCYNLWKGFATKPAQGDWSLLKKHIFENVCNGNQEWFDYFMGWMARMFQKPDCPGEVAIVLRGGKGVGKSIVFNIIGHLLGQHFVKISNQNHLVGNFNSHLQDVIFLFADEAYWAGDKKGEGVLKTLITEKTLFIEPKGVNAFTCPNFLHIAMASNASWVVPASGDERRFFVLDVSETKKQDTQYFGAIVDQMKNGGNEALLHDLLHWDISVFNVRQVPATDAIQEQKIRSMEPIDKWIYERLCAGRWLLHDYDPGKFVPPQDDWMGAIRTRDIQNEYFCDLKDMGISRRASQTELGMRLKKVFPDMRKMNQNKHSVYTFPPLEECRALFEAFNNTSYDWPEEEVEKDTSPI